MASIPVDGRLRAGRSKLASVDLPTSAVTDSRGTTIGDQLAYTGSTFARATPTAYSVKLWGAKCDGILCFGGMTSGSATFTSSTQGSTSAAVFQTSDVGKLICVPGAGASGADLVTTISAVPSPGTSSCTLTTAAGTTVLASATRTYYATNDLPALTAALAAVIPQGGVLELPPNTMTGVNGPVDFGPMGTVTGGLYRPLTFRGQGGANNESIGQSTSVILNFNTGPAVKSYQANVTGLHLRDFLVLSVTDIGQTNFAVDLSRIYADCSVKNVRVVGRGDGNGHLGTRPNVGNGIRIDNPAVGQIVLENVVAAKFDAPPAGGFQGSEGFRFGAENPAPDGGAGVNSGNIVCSALRSTCTVGFRWKAGALFNGGTFNSLKAIMDATVAFNGGNIGFWFEGSQQAQHTLNSPHAEGYHTAYWFNGSQGIQANAPLASMPVGSVAGDGSAAFLFDNTALGNIASGASIGGSPGFDTGVTFSGSASGNQWVGRWLTGYTALTSKFSRNGLNSIVDLSAGASAYQAQSPGLVAPFDPRLILSAAAVSANALQGCRVIVPASGILHDLAVFVGTTSGNLRMAIYDTGDASSGFRTRLWDSGIVAVGATNTWQIVGDPALAVSAGQELEFAIECDNVTATFGRHQAFIAAQETLPTSFWPVPGGASPKLAWTFGIGSFTTPPASIGEASIAVTGQTFCLIARVV